MTCENFIFNLHPLAEDDSKLELTLCNKKFNSFCETIDISEIENKDFFEIWKESWQSAKDKNSDFEPTDEMCELCEKHWKEEVSANISISNDIKKDLYLKCCKDLFNHTENIAIIEFSGNNDSFIYKDELFDIISNSENGRSQIIFRTDCSLLTEEDAFKLVSLKNSGKNIIVWSNIAGYDEKTLQNSNFETLVNVLNILYTEGLIPEIFCDITKDRLGWIKEMREQWGSLIPGIERSIILKANKNDKEVIESEEWQEYMVEGLTKVSS